jgi:hypothetical protein
MNAAKTGPLTVGIMVPGANLTEKLAWLNRSAESHNAYILEINADENIVPTTLEYQGAINITIALRGAGENRTIRLRSHGTMFTVKPNVTFVLENNITLQGHSGNTSSSVRVDGGTLKMRTGSAITGNLRSVTGNTGGGGVYVSSKGAFEMTGGTVSGNSASSGGGVYVDDGTFTMTGGTVSNNSASSGGGVYVDSDNATFTMSGGSISGNSASMGGGVYVSWYIHRGGTFTMTGGTVSGNTANEGGGAYITGNGGGAYITGNFTMRGGTITGNTAANAGGGVWINNSFTKRGGTITGYNSDQNNGNVVRDGDGNVLVRRGHAVWFGENRRKETTAGPGVNLSNDADWDN